MITEMSFSMSFIDHSCEFSHFLSKQVVEIDFFLNTVLTKKFKPSDKLSSSNYVDY